MAETAAPVFELVIPTKHALVLTFRKRLEDGTYFDFTGYEARAQVRAGLEPDAEVLLELDGTNGRLVVDETRLRLVVEANVTSELTFEAGWWDLVTETPGGRVLRFLQGPAVLDRGVTP